MAQEAFFYPAGCIPTMDVEEILSHVRTLDGEAYFSCITVLDDSDRHDKEALLEYIRQYDYALFETLENILRAFQTAYHQADEARVFLTRGYHRYRILKRSLAFLEETPVSAVQKTVQRKKGAQKKKARAIAPEDEEREDNEEQELLTAFKSSEEPGYKKETFYTKKEPFHIEAFPHQDYVHVVPKSQKRMKLEDLPDRAQWDTIYHVNGPWMAERLQEVLFLENQESIIVKRKRGGPDAEVFAYKVLAGKAKSMFVAPAPVTTSASAVVSSVA